MQSGDSIFALPPDVRAAAEALDVRFDRLVPAQFIRGGYMIPALLHFTVIDPGSPAFRASFTVRLSDLSPGALRTKHAAVVENFTEPAELVP